MQQVAELDGLVGEQLRRDDRRQLARVPLHPRRVRAGADVARLERVRQRTERLAVGPLDVAAVTALDLEQAPHVTGVEQELVGGQRLGGLGEQRRRRRAGRALDRGEQVERAERLPHDGSSAGIAAGLLLEVAAGEQDDPDLARLVGRIELARERDAVDAGQADVEHDHVGPRARDRLDRLLGARGLLDPLLDELEGRAQQLPQRRVVVDHEDLQAGPRRPSFAAVSACAHHPLPCRTT